MMTDDMGERGKPFDVGRLVERFGPCNYCSQPLVRLPNGQWGVAGDVDGKRCPDSPDGWHQADPLGDGSFSIGSDVWPGLSKAIEEAGEFLQVAGKVIATHGASGHWDGSDLRERFKEEVADLFAALNFVLGESFTPAERIAVGERMARKERLFCEWQDAQTTGDLGSSVEDDDETAG